MMATQECDDGMSRGMTMRCGARLVMQVALTSPQTNPSYHPMQSR